MFRDGLYARVSTHDQKTLPLQLLVPVRPSRELREKLLAAARRREIDAVLVWWLDRWGRSLADLVVTLKELAALGVGFVSFTLRTGPPVRWRVTGIRR